MTTPFFIFFVFLFLLPSAYAEITITATANVLGQGDTAVFDDEVVDIPVDLSGQIETVPETTKTVGGEPIEITQVVRINTSDQNEVLTLKSTQLPNIEILIPDQTIISGPDEWDGRLVPPVPIVSGGTVPSGFLVPTGAILVGSSNAVLIFDTPVTLILNGTTGTTAYKTPGSDNWIVISGCTGTYTNPNNPSNPNECAIGNGIDTKILTYHFTEFAGLSTPAPTESTSSSGGHGNTGVGSPRIFGPSSGSSGGGGTYYGSGDSTPRVFPAWFDNVKDWYRLGDISATEFLNAYQWIIENIMK